MNLLTDLDEIKAKPDPKTQRYLVRPAEFAKLVSTSKSTIYRLIQEGLPVVHVGATMRIDPADAVAWLKAQSAREAAE